MLARTPLLLISILLLALILRAFVPIAAIELGRTEAAFHGGDTSEYVRGAIGLLNERAYSDKGVSIVKRTPGYSLFLIPGILFGHLELITIILQIFLGTFSVFLVWKISNLLFGKESIALFCSFLFAIEPLAIFFSCKLLSETLFVFVLLSFVLFFLKYLKQRKLSYLLLSSIALSLSVYVRPVSYYLPFLIVLMIFYQALWEKENRWKLAKHAAIFFLVCSIIIGAWKVRNYVQTGYTGFSSLAEINLYMYYGETIKAIKEGKPIGKDFNPRWEEFLKYYEEKHPNDKDLNRRNTFLKHEAFRLITENPGILITICLKGLVKTMADPGINRYLILFKGQVFSFASLWEKGGNKKVALILNLVFAGMIVIYWVLAITGIFQPNADRTGVTLLVMLVVYLAAITAGPYSYSRFRVPIMPFLCILGGAGFFILRDKFAVFRTKKNS